VITVQNLKSYIAKAKSIPSLRIEEMKIDEQYRLEKIFKEEMLKPITGQRIHENIVEFPVWEDSEVFGNIIPPWGYQKFSRYEVTTIGLGLVKISQKWGKHIRKSSDFRFLDEKDVSTIEYYFLYDDWLRHYREVNPEKSSDWQQRVGEVEGLENEAVSFVFDFLIKKWRGFLTIVNDFKLSDTLNYTQINHHLDIIDEFLDDYQIYSDILFVVYSDITNNEHEALQEAIHKQRVLNQTARKYMSSFTYDTCFDVTKDYHNRANRKDPFGPITTAIMGIKTILTPRQEKIDEDSWFVYNVNKGYLKMDKFNNGLCPNPAEIERRRGLYKHPFNAQSEKKLLKEIKERFR
jgi:hypothetical protein